METYPKLVKWGVENFMSIEKATCEFDERNIINIKGYNDSGKSAMLTALKVLMTNCNPAKQAGFIQDDKNYFRVVATFEDGVQILRDKYINGQSLYEMYKNGELAYSTKSKSGMLTKVSEVPQPIADYLGLVEYDGVYLNARSCFEKQLGVQTTGSENYKMFNTVLKAEEIANASALLNVDKNKLNADIGTIDNQINGLQQAVSEGKGLTRGIIDYLKEHDSIVDSFSIEESLAVQIVDKASELSDVIVLPEVEVIDGNKVLDLVKIQRIEEQIRGILIAPTVEPIKSEQLSSICEISEILEQLSGVQCSPEVDSIGLENLSILSEMVSICNDIAVCVNNCAELDAQIVNTDKELIELQEQAKQTGIAMVRCPDCGRVFNPDEAHIH